MVYRFLFFIFFIGAGLSTAQQKYFVFFKDKGLYSPHRIYKTAQISPAAISHLSEKSIERRKQAMGENEYFNYDDLPVYAPYIDELKKLSIKTDKTLNWFNAVSCYIEDENLEIIKALPFVEKIEKVKSLVSLRQDNLNNYPGIFMPSPAPSILSFNYGSSYSQNALSDIPEAHNAGLSGKDIIVGVLDTGFELTSPAFETIKILAQHDFVFNDDVTANQSGDIQSQHNHGTAVLSIMAGMHNGFQIGPAYGASFLLAKTEDVRSEKNIEEDNYAAALEWMEARGVRITSSSLGYTTFDDGQSSYTYNDMNGRTTIVTKAAEMAFERGVIVLTAAGNDGNNSWHYISAPGDGKNTITVGALTPGGQVASYSSRGPTSDGRIKPDISTQGSNVVHSLPLQITYGMGNGTSYATPIAAGITALLLEAYPYLTNIQVRDILLQSGDNSAAPNNDRGYGLLSAVKALNQPNIQKIGNSYKINKMFIGVDNAADVKLNYSLNSVAQNPLNMVKSSGGVYSVQLPQFNAGDAVRFTISYESPEGTVTVPSTEYYGFAYGQMTIKDFSYGAQPSAPASYRVFQNYPNPFSRETKIKINLPSEDRISVDIYNVIGQKVVTLFDGQMSAGEKTLTWDGRNYYGVKCPSGVYVYTVKSNSSFEIKKMVLVK